jgi:hypothetical protein
MEADKPKDEAKPIKDNKVTVRAKRCVNIDGVHLEPKAEHRLDPKRAKSIGADLIEILED